jgi:hypothetical protein
MRIDEATSSAVKFAQAALDGAGLDDTATLVPAAATGFGAGAGTSSGFTLAELRHDGTDGAFLLAARYAPATLTPAQSQVDGYRVGAPSEPAVQFDEDFVYDSAQATRGDYLSAIEWRAKLAGAQTLRPDLADATRAYAHYWSNSGETLRVDYARAYRSDSGVRSNVDTEVARTAAAVDAMAAGQGTGTFSVTGPARPAGAYPSTENWQKAIGGYQQWSSADVTVNGNQVSMRVTVHMMDRYNFNRGQADIASGAPDNANGRFTELGWARPFDTRGDITRTVTWTLGSPPTAAEVASQLSR